MAIDFPNSPANGAVFTTAGKTWVYNSTSLTWGLRTIVTGDVTTAHLADGAVTAVKIATGAVTAAKLDTTYAPIASPTLTGVPAAPTASAGTDTTQIATTAFVLANAPATNLTGPITSVGNATSIASQTGTGDTFAMSVAPTFTGTVTGITKAMVGLNNVNNTADANKPVSIAGQTALDLKSDLADPTFTGVPAAPTATAGTNTTQLSTTAFVRTEVAALVDSSPASLDTLNELALALGSDPNFATTVTNSLAAKAPLADPIFTGTVTLPVGTVTSGMILDGTIASGDIASSAITAAKVATDAITETKILDGAVTQAKLGSGLSGITVTTTANRGTVIPSPFTGQFAYLTDTSSLTLWDGAAWASAVTTVPTGAPTSVAVSGSPTLSTVTLTFSAGPDGGSTITNYEYDLSTNDGVTYAGFAALSPADASSPITISGLAWDTTYSVKLKAVNALGTGSSESAAVSFTTAGLSVNYLVVAGGGGGGRTYAGGGGAGGLRSTVTATGGGGALESALSLGTGTYTVTVGTGGAGKTGGVGGVGAVGGNSIFATITATGGGGGGGYNAHNASNGGSGGGGGSESEAGGNYGLKVTGQGYDGAPGSTAGSVYRGGGGGGAGAAGATGNVSGNGGAGSASSITGSSVTLSGGGGGGKYNVGGTAGSGGSGGGGAGGYGVTGTAGTANTGGGGGGAGGIGSGDNAGPNGANGGSGVVILRWLTADASITVGAGLTADATGTDGSHSYKRFTAGTGNVSWA